MNRIDPAKKGIFGGAVTVAPATGLRGELAVPGDKSISHRSVMLGSIADGTTEVEGFLEGEDNLSTIAAFGAMGVRIERPAPSRVLIEGRGMRGLCEPEDVIDAGNSGTTVRLLTGLLSAQGFFSVLTGDDTLRRRPMRRVVDPLRLMGASIYGRRGASLLPLSITGSKLHGISYTCPVASAQLKSAILLAGIYADGRTVVEEPGASRDHTERMLRTFGAQVEAGGNRTSVVSTKRLNGCRIIVPGDISSAAFFIAASMITPASQLIAKGVGVNPTRTGVIDILRRMGGSVETLGQREVSGEPVADILVKSSPLRGIEITGAELLPAIDEFPVICVAAAYAEGTTTITGAGELRVKESDRIAAMAECLRAVGCTVREMPDGIAIEGNGGAPLRGGRIDSRGDHRIAMSMAVAALGSERGVEIEGAGAVDVSFPGFFPTLDGVRAS
ncbi:MAG: 3-phosphoshikimate 1-carboxyvinyltransferase [Thermodesulfobacteriota bacterium]